MNHIERANGEERSGYAPVEGPAINFVTYGLNAATGLVRVGEEAQECVADGIIWTARAWRPVEMAQAARFSASWSRHDS